LLHRLLYQGHLRGSVCVTRQAAAQAGVAALVSNCTRVGSDLVSLLGLSKPRVLPKTTHKPRVRAWSCPQRLLPTLTEAVWLVVQLVRQTDTRSKFEGSASNPAQPPGLTLVLSRTRLVVLFDTYCRPKRVKKHCLVGLQSLQKRFPT